METHTRGTCPSSQPAVGQRAPPALSRGAATAGVARLASGRAAAAPAAHTSHARELSARSSLALAGWWFCLPILPSPSPCGSGPSPLCPHPRPPGVESPSPVPLSPGFSSPFIPPPLRPVQPTPHHRPKPLPMEPLPLRFIKAGAEQGAPRGGQRGESSWDGGTRGREQLRPWERLASGSESVLLVTGHDLCPQNRPTRALWLVLKTR